MRAAGARQVLIAVVLLVLPCSSACDPSGIRTGSAIGRLYGTVVGGAEPLPPHARIGELMLYVHNVSDQPIVLRSVHLSGSGLGTTVRAIEIEAAPELPGIHAIPGGAYRTDPPVWRDPQGACHSAVLRPLEGFSLAAGGEMRVWVVLETLAPGAFFIRSHTVSYSQGGLDYEQVLPIGYRGEVERGADPPRLDRTERPCLHRTSVLEAKGEPAGPIRLGRLPAVGVAIGEQDGVVFIDTEGAVETRLAGFELVGNAGAPGLWLRSGRSYYRMDAFAGAVEPVSTKVAKRRM